jgi:hypothetical protein
VDRIPIFRPEARIRLLTFPLYAFGAAACIFPVVLTGQTRGPVHEHTIDLVSAPAMRTGDTVAPERRLSLNQPVAVASHAPVKQSPARERCADQFSDMDR